jgi:hypothetical protein
VTPKEWACPLDLGVASRFRAVQAVRGTIAATTTR